MQRKVQINGVEDGRAGGTRRHRQHQAGREEQDGRRHPPHGCQSLGSEGKLTRYFLSFHLYFHKR